MSNIHKYEELQVDGLRAARRLGLGGARQPQRLGYAAPTWTGNGLLRVIMVPLSPQFLMDYQQFFNIGSGLFGYGCGGPGFGRF
ncbi:hypothetical protein I4U23_005247 [Adineta vaga]|nr:hypothetical protein I4U23_005247 [Adineta vaga]